MLTEEVHVRSKMKMKQKCKRMLTVALCAVIGILIVFKGSSFLIENINMLLWHMDHGIIWYGNWLHRLESHIIHL